MGHCYSVPVVTRQVEHYKNPERIWEPSSYEPCKHCPGICWCDDGKGLAHP